MKSRQLAVLLMAAAVSGCAITQNVKPIDSLASNEVCVVMNPTVQHHGFLTTYQQALMDKGYLVRQLPPGTPVNACPVVSTYTANWRWDLALYMAYADIKVYSNGVQSGQATYDALQGGFNMSKFIKGESKVVELVNQLFPGNAKRS